MNYFSIYPIFGSKTSVPENSPQLFKPYADGVATYDVGGRNFSLSRERGACTKANGFTQWDNTANAQATKCLGLYRLVAGSNEDYCYWDNGKFYVFDSNKDPEDKTGAGLTYANNNSSLVSAITVGTHVVFTGVDWPATAGDNGMVQKWDNGDANATLLIDPSGGSGYTEYKFRYLAYFGRRIIGLYSDQTNGDIDVRWTDALPDLSSDVEFPAANQAYIPNDDSINGCAKIAQSLAIYCKNSINLMTYYPDYETPFRINIAVGDQGFEGHHGIINLGTRHFGFNKHYGFCDYAGGRSFPASTMPISIDIENRIQGINSSYYDLIYGVFDGRNKRLVWAVPADGATTPNELWAYDLLTQSWEFLDYSCRVIDVWEMSSNYTWNDLVAELGTNATWNFAGISAWANYTSRQTRFVTGGTDGKLYTMAGESMPSGENDGYRIEPIMDFGDSSRKETLQEIWFDIGTKSSCNLDVYYRGGDTVGEVTGAAWTQLSSLSLDSPDKPVVFLSETNRYHQIKYRTELDNELWQINKVTFGFIPQSQN